MDLHLASLEARLRDCLWAINHLDDSRLDLRIQAASIVDQTARWESAWHRWRQDPENTARPM